MSNAVMNSGSKPVVLTVVVENIPDELKSMKQWVGWRYVFRKGKCAKPPISCLNGRRADPTDPKDWTTFEKALKGLCGRNLDGIGFVFTEDDPYTGIDLDDCRDPDTGEMDGWADAIVRKLDSYTEVSPSGTGVKVIVRGVLLDPLAE